MFVEQCLRNRLHLRVEQHRIARHLGDDFKRKCGLDGFRAARSPRERAVAVDEHGGDFVRVQLFKTLDDDVAGFPFVRRLDFLRRHRARDRNLAVKIIGVRGVEARDSVSGGCKRDGVTRVRVHDGANAVERLEEPAVRRRVGRRTQRTFGHLAVKIDDDHVAGLHRVVIDAARFDGEDAARRITDAHVAEREVDKFEFRQQQVCLVALRLEIAVAHRAYFETRPRRKTFSPGYGTQSGFGVKTSAKPSCLNASKRTAPQCENATAA